MDEQSALFQRIAARDLLYEQGYEVSICHIPQDHMGKDWSERYRRTGRAGLAPLHKAPG
jgi:hypothetical protein